MTAFQYLACNPTAFQNEKMQIKRGVIEHLNKWKAPTIIQYTIGFLTELCMLHLPLSSSCIMIYYW